MKGLLVCLAVGCLAIVSAAPAEESNKQITKHFKFHNDGLFDYPVNSVQDELVTVRCKNTTVLAEDVQKCSIHLDKLYSYDKLNTSCYIPSLKLYGEFKKSLVLANDGNSKAVLALKDGETKVKLISVNLKDCKIYETSVNTSSSFESIENDGHLDVAIVAHDKNYDVFFRNREICWHYLCKATIDYEGKVVKAAAVFPIQIVRNEYLNIKHVNNGYLVMQRYDVLLVKDGEDTARLLLRQVFSDPIVSSTEENKITLCFVLNYNTAMCKQYDVDGKIKISEFEFQIDPESRLDAIAVQNTEKGLILAASEKHRSKDKEETWVTSIVSLDDQGKQLKNVKVDLEFNKPFAFPFLYKNSNGQYCAQFVQSCMKHREPPCTNNQKGVEFFISTRCFTKTELL